VPVGHRRVDPSTEPHGAEGAGAAGDGGRLGASWQLSVLPRHRAVLQKYFGAESTDRERR
jgi:hypothetical protein